MHKVSIVRVKQDNLEQSITEAMELVDWKTRIKQHGRVCIKPNMGNTTFVTGVITRPDIIHYVVKIVKTWASEVIVGESDGTHYDCDFVKTGVKDAVESAGGKVVNFSHDVQVKVPVKGLYWKEVVLPKTVVDADSFITMPVIKTHETTIMTCAIKNQFGCIANRYRCLYHNHLHEVLADINLAIKPDLVVTDGTYCMEGNGPIHGPVKELGIIMASDNVVANDMAVAQIMGVDWIRIKHIANSVKLGVGTQDIESLGINPIEFYPFDYQLPKLDIVAKTLERVANSPTLTRLLLLSPMFGILKRGTWFYRGLKGVKPRT